MSARSADPVLSYQYAVDVKWDPPLLGGLSPIDGFLIPIKGYFGEVSGLDVEWETVEYKTTNFLGATHSNFVRLRPVYHPITLRRGVTGNEGFWLWHQALALGLKAFLRANVTITMYDRSYEPLVQWTVEHAWPSRVSGPQIRADSSDIAIEELTLVHSGIRRMLMLPGMAAVERMLNMLVPAG